MKWNTCVGSKARRAEKWQHKRQVVGLKMLHVLRPGEDLLINKAAFFPAFSSESEPSKRSRKGACMQNNSSFYT